MSDPSGVAPDPLDAIASPEVQKTAARMAQDAFAGIFRLSAGEEPGQLEGTLAELGNGCANWSQAGADDEARALRLALLISGMDQWGLAYSQAFGLTAIPPLTAFLGSLRTRLDAAADARFQRYFTRIDSEETAAIDFKVELRRGIHLALWHAMTACDNAEAAQAILQRLGGLMLALLERMPRVGWRLLADALASIQLHLLANSNAAPPLAQETTQQLFESLRQALPKEKFQEILAYSSQAVLAWQQSRRPAN